MKILFLLNSYTDDGPGRITYGIIEGLKQFEDVECYTAALRRSGPLKEKFDDLVVPTKIIGMKYLYQIGKFKELVTYLRDGKFDIINTNLIRADIIGRKAARKAGVPIIMTTEHGIHTWCVKGKIIEALVKKIYLQTTRYTDRIVAVSDYVKRSLLEAGVPPEKIERIYNGVNLERFVPVTPDEKREFVKYLTDRDIKHLIGGVGHLVTLKGHQYLIKSIPQILGKHPDSLIIIVGEGPLHQHLIKEVNKMGLQEKVRFLGRMSTITPRLISALDVLVQPSLTESFGLVVVEAFACGVPVVATDVGGLPEIVQDGENGFLVAPRHPAAIADKVTWLLDHYDEARKMGERGREYVSRRFDIKVAAQKYHDLYTSLYNEKTLTSQK